MDWLTYKARCDAPGVWSRWMLEQTLELLQCRHASAALCARLSARLECALLGPALPKPADHIGGPSTDMFELAFNDVEVRGLMALVRTAQAADFRTSGTMARGLGGFAQAWQEYLVVLGAEGSEPQSGVSNAPSTWEGKMSTATERVVTMIEAWNRMDLDGIIHCFAEDAIYHNMPMEPVQGTEAIRSGLSSFLATANQVQWDILNIAENSSGTVLTERVDRFKIGSKWIAVPVMGTFEVHNDRITGWRDYFDLADFQAQMAALER